MCVAFVKHVESGTPLLGQEHRGAAGAPRGGEERGGARGLRAAIEHTVSTPLSPRTPCMRLSLYHFYSHGVYVAL